MYRTKGFNQKSTNVITTRNIPIISQKWVSMILHSVGNFSFNIEKILNDLCVHMHLSQKSILGVFTNVFALVFQAWRFG